MRRLQLSLPVADRLRVWQHRLSQNPAIHHQMLKPVMRLHSYIRRDIGTSTFPRRWRTNAEEWLEYFKRYIAFKQLPHDVALPLFALLMRGPANTWFGALLVDDRDSYTRATEAFQAKFGPTPLNKWKKASELWSCT